MFNINMFYEVGLNQKAALYLYPAQLSPRTNFKLLDKGLVWKSDIA